MESTHVSPRNLESLQALYAEKKTTPDEAVRRYLRSGAVCGTDIALSHSPRFYEAAAQAIQRGELDNITQHCLLDTARSSPENTTAFPGSPKVPPGRPLTPELPT